MKFFDEATVYLKAGDGGNGKCSFRREKFVEFGGPDGGNGGKGGDIILQADKNDNTLLFFHKQPHQKADDGHSGDKKNRTGKSADDKILKVPLGTQIYDESGEVLLFDLIEHGEKLDLLQGGNGGLGNAMFKNSSEQAPRTTTQGGIGKSGTFKLKLKLISDVGLLGLPNAGKSSFISQVTNARPKVANYAFTTLKPTLGVAEIQNKNIILCDIPGLIENAHKGVGLGDKFLKHIERCKILLHLIDINQKDPVNSYYLIRNELKCYSSILAKKPEIVALSKMDTVDEELQKIIQKEFTKLTGITPILLSTFDNNSANKILEQILKCCI